jgi:hypothetical protein
MKDDLTPKQAEALGQRILPMLRFLSLCRKRLDSGGYDTHSEFYAIVVQAHEAFHSLRVYLHYWSIEHGVGEPPHKGEPERDQQSDPPHP